MTNRSVTTMTTTTTTTIPALAAASATAAPAAPAWLAECVLWIGRDLADLWRDSAGASPALWARINLRRRRAAIAEAMAHTDDLAVLGICAEVTAMLDAELAGESIGPEAWVDAEQAAQWCGGVAARTSRAATWAAEAAARTARAAWAAPSEASAAEAATWAAGEAAGAAAVREATGVTTGQRAARAWVSASVVAAVDGAQREAAGRITAEFLAAWRAELDAQTTGDRS